MRNRNPFSPLRLLSASLLVLATILTVFQLVRFSAVRAYLPYGMRIAGVPVGGLDREGAIQRLLKVYSTPIQLNYYDAVIDLPPDKIDFQLNVENMLAVAELQRTQHVFWQDFWDYLWNRTSSPQEIPLSATYSETLLRDFLVEVAQRYDQPAQAALAVPGSASFQPGQNGASLDIDASVVLIENSLNSLNNRVVSLPIDRTSPTRPSFQNLGVLLRQTLQVNAFDGLAGIYLLDLQTAQEIHFAYQQGQDLPVEPDIAFTASSTIKLPIMIAAFRRMGASPDPESISFLEKMIDQSGNEAADWLMNRVIDPRRAPLQVTEDMHTLGLENTFLAGYFSLGSPLLQSFQTPANQRADINTDPDLYSQTTPSDLGMMLEDLYQCAQNGGGTLPVVFPGEITQAKCQKMIDYLIANRLPSLLTAGLPEGTQIAHKHGWVSNASGYINTIGDAGIIYSPGGNYILVVFLHHPIQLLWDRANPLIAQLSRAVYNYYNLPEQ